MPVVVRVAISLRPQPDPCLHITPGYLPGKGYSTPAFSPRFTITHSCCRGRCWKVFQERLCSALEERFLPGETPPSAPPSHCRPLSCITPLLQKVWPGHRAAPGSPLSHRDQAKPRLPGCHQPLGTSLQAGRPHTPQDRVCPPLLSGVPSHIRAAWSSQGSRQLPVLLPSIDGFPLSGRAPRGPPQPS